MNDASPDGTMSDPKKCPQCGATLPTGALDGLCPACLLRQGASKDSATQPAMPPFEPPPLTELARLFPQLEVLELIGKGGMGAVYKARQPSLDRFVALKILPPETVAGQGFGERFNREARALARLGHPNIVAVYDFGQAGGLHYFLMEFVDGVNLRQLQRAGRLSPREALQIIPQICDALQYAHDESVVHRDIKPENVLVDRKGRVKIADFGLAKILGRDPADLRLTGEGQVMGTPHYMAPEQIEHPLEVDHRADIYSLGVVFYEMLTGELPLGRFAPPSRKVRVDVRLDEVVLHALEKEPELRYQHASQVKTDVETIVGHPLKSPAGGNQHKPAMAAVSRGSALTAAAVGLTVFLLVLITTAAVTLALQKSYAAQVKIMMHDELMAAGPDGDARKNLEVEALLSQSVLGEAAKLAGLKERWREKSRTGMLDEAEVLALLRSQLAVHLLPKLAVMNVRVFADSPQEAAATANAIARAYLSARGGRLVEQASPPQRPARPNIAFNLAVGTLLGFALGGLVSGLILWRATRTAKMTGRGQRHDPAGRRAENANEPGVTANGTRVVQGAEAANRRREPWLLWALGTVVILLFMVPIGLLVLYQLNSRSIGFRDNSIPFSPAAEVWSPSLAPGEKPDPGKILEEANALAAQGQYEDAMQRHLWYHDHALEYNAAQTGVRLSFALSAWVELGRKYPKAMQALVEIRDRKTRDLAEGRGAFALFQDVASINGYLQDEDATFALFKTVQEKDPALAKQCFIVAEDLLVKKGEYALCLSFIPDPEAKLMRIRQSWETDQALARNNSTLNRPDFRKGAEDRFVTKTRHLIEILVGTGHKAEAEKIGEQALKLLDDPRLKTAISDAEKRVNK